MPDVGGFLGDAIGSAVSSAFDDAMKSFWDGALTVLQQAFEIADQMSVFSVSTTAGPLGAVWPTMLWVSGMVALGMFFVQLTTMALRGGRGFLRTVTGPVQYGLALGLTVTAVGLLLAGADGMSAAIIHYGLDARNFQEAMHATGLLDATVDIAKPVVLGLVAVFGILPIGIGCILEMLFRQAAIVTLVATVPIAAAGLVAQVSHGWYWRTVRWLIAAIAVKPALALTLVLGFGSFVSARGLKELLVGCGILLIALFSPFVLFRLLAFVDPASEPGAAFRDWVESRGLSPPSPLGSGSGGEETLEDAHTGRFDSITTDDSSAGDSSVFEPEHSDWSKRPDDDPAEQSHSAEDNEREPANRGSVVAGPGWRKRADSERPGETSAGGGEAAAGGEAAVIV